MPASGPRYSPSQLNFFKFAQIVLDEFPKALRQVFKTMWDNKGTAQPWDDSVAVRKQFSLFEGTSPKIPTSYEQWDCTALFKATIFAKTFAGGPTNMKLKDLYLTSLIPPQGSFRSTVTSSTGNQDETFALAIDQLRLLRNTISHPFSTNVIDRATFLYYIKCAKMAFTALNFSTSSIDEIRDLAESDFPTTKVAELEERIKEMQDDKKRFSYISGIQIVLLLLILLVTVAIYIGLFYKPVRKPVPSAVPGWMNTSNPMFIGRRWLFKQLEDFFEKKDTLNGALLVGDPGSGKTAIVKQLVNSPINSSRFIHQNIIAYHFCEFDTETTRDGEKFVKSLVEQLSQTVPGFEKSIRDNEAIQNKLLYDCKNAPIECAKRTVLEPLHVLKKLSSKTKKFILIDALDECREKEGSRKSVIIDILHLQEIGLPSWVKLLMSSRNVTTITGKMSEIKVGIIAMNAKSKDNLDDIRLFAQEMISRYDFRKKNGESMKEKLNESIESILNTTDGNFLFIKTLLDDWASNPDKINLTSIPSDMNHKYARSFRERFEEKELKRFAKFFEVLLASNSPPTLQLLNGIFTLKDPMYECDEVADKLSAYIRFNSGTVRFYHQSFAEWLTNHKKHVKGFSVKNSRGHQYIADYLFDHYNQPENELTVKGLYELSMHVLNGGMLKTHVRKLKRLNSDVTDQFNECILHYLARNRESTEVLKLFIQQFKSVDMFNKEGLTAAYYATIAGNYRNLKLLIEKGADINYVPKRNVRKYCDAYSMFWRSSLHKYYSLIFTAAHKGYTKIVDLLINHDAHLDKEDECGWKPLHVAVREGHLKTVQRLINKTARTSSDVFALHQATVFNHSDVLKFLLDTGIRDKCIRCKRDYQDSSNFNLTIHRFLEEICGSVLNTAMSRNNLNIVKILLSNGKETLECRSFAGLTPLMRAVERNNTKMVTLLLDEGADVEAQCETNNVDEYIKLKYLWFFLSSSYDCSCSNKAIHISAIKGTSEITTELIKRNADPFSRDCMGWSAIDLAAMHHQYVNTSLLNKYSSLLNNKTVVRYLAVCGSVKTLELLSRNRSSRGLTTVHEDGMTLLHLATLGLTNLFHSVCTMINCAAFRCPRADRFTTYHREEQYLETIKLLTKVTPQNINKKDIHGRTALHYAALVRSPDVVKHLIQKGSDWKIKDESGDTALKFVLKRPIDYINLGPCSTVIYSLLNSSEMAISNEMHVSCLIMFENLNTAKCGTRLPSRIIRYMAFHNLPLSWYTLLKIDADLNCLFYGYPNFFLNSYDQILQPIATISELLKVFKLDVKVNCEVPFDYSNLHIIAFYLYFDVDRNYFSSLQRLVDNHLMGSRILDKRYDMEGYLPFHRAVLGGNINAVDWFVKLGVDIWKKTRSGWTALDLSLTDRQCLPRILDKLLTNITRNPEYKVPSGSAFWCNTTSTPLSLLHIAAINGLRCLSYIRKNTFIAISLLPFTSCNNIHGIDILYLTKLYHDVEWTTKWKGLGLPTNTTLSKYPEREAEYHLVYNNFFLTPDVNLNLKFEVNAFDLFRFPGINNLLPHKHVIEGQIERCSIRCRQSASHASRSFLSTFRTVFVINYMFDPLSDGFIDIVPQMAELRYRCVQMFYKVSSTLWRQVSKAYTCSHKCRCLKIMRLLQKEFTSNQFWFRTVGEFVAERMGWHDTSRNGDVLYRWPFSFLLKKALKMYKDYEYLKILTARDPY